MSYQQILIQGNLTRDAEVRQVGQSQVAKIGVAVSEKFRKQDGTIGENAEFFEVEVWDKPNLYPYLLKGQSVLVVGKQKTDTWQDQNGQNRAAKKVRCFEIQLCGSKPQSEQTGTAPNQPAYAPQTYQARPVSAPPTPPTPPNYPTPPPPPGGYMPTPPPGSEQYRDLPPDF